MRESDKLPFQRGFKEALLIYGKRLVFFLAFSLVVFLVLAVIASVQAIDISKGLDASNLEALLDIFLEVLSSVVIVALGLKFGDIPFRAVRNSSGKTNQRRKIRLSTNINSSSNSRVTQGFSVIRSNRSTARSVRKHLEIRIHFYEERLAETVDLKQADELRKHIDNLRNQLSQLEKGADDKR